MIYTICEGVTMNYRVKIQPIGEALGAILPKEILDKMNVGPNDELLAVQTDDGILLTPYDPTLASGLKAFEVGKKKYREALRELAK